MDYNLLAQDNKFHDWAKLEPVATDYTKYAETDPSIIAAAHKIVDVYSAFASAKQSFRSAGYENYGDLCGDDEISKLYTKTHFLVDAVIEYAICLDLSWQVIWAYIQPASFEYLCKNEYKKMEKECDRDNLLAQLDCAIAQKNLKAERIKNIFVDFDNNENVTNLRTLYNSRKHRGTIHFVGLGENDKTMANGVYILSREEYTVESVENILLTYHQNFQPYFNALIAEIIPVDYMNKKVSFIDHVNTALKMGAIQNKEN
jgi:hypothetical protein